MWRWLAMIAAVVSWLIAIVQWINGESAIDWVQFGMIWTIIAQLEEEKR
jgi:hypothetical protein